MRDSQKKPAGFNLLALFGLTVIVIGALVLGGTLRNYVSPTGGTSSQLSLVFGVIIMILGFVMTYMGSSKAYSAKSSRKPVGKGQMQKKASTRGLTIQLGFLLHVTRANTSTMYSRSLCYSTSLWVLSCACKEACSDLSQSPFCGYRSQKNRY